MKTLRRVAVLGAGTMGARIAAHFANAGIPSLLLDIVLPDQPDRNRRRPQDSRTRRSRSRVRFFTEAGLALVTPGNFEDDLAEVGPCDWIIEAVTENLEIKRGCGAKWQSLRTPGAILSTNTSGIPLAAISEGFRPRVPAAFPGHSFLQSAALPAPGGNDSRRRDRARRCWSSCATSATAGSARAWCRARIRPTSSPTASACFFGAHGAQGHAWRATTPSRKWMRSPVR